MEINGKHIMFKAENLRITPYEIAKETASNVWYKKEKFLIDINAPKEFFNELKSKQGRYHYWAETFDEAKQQIKLHARESDTCYVQIASKMPLPEFRPMRYRAKVNEDTILRAENGRVLSRREIRGMQGIG